MAAFEAYADGLLGSTWSWLTTRTWSSCGAAMPRMGLVTGDTINELFADDVVWHVAGRSPLAGDYSGKEQVFGFFGKLQEMSDGTAKVEVHDLTANDTHGVALVTESATRNGRSHQGRATHVLHLVDGKVTEFWDAQTDQYSADEFWS